MRCPLKKYLVPIFILFFSVNVFAASHYIRAGATGANNGSSWANAWTTFSTVTWTRGDTYYVAGGAYTENIVIPTLSGTSWITIKKANATDNSSDSNWDPSYAATQAVINGKLRIGSSYVKIDGVTGSGESGHGIKIHESILAGNTKVVDVAQIGSIYLHHLEIRGSGYAGATGQDGIYWVNVNTLPQKGLHVSYCYIHEVTRNGVTIGAANGTSYDDYGVLFENNFLSETGGCTDVNTHGQGIQVSWSSTDYYTIFRNNIFRNVLGTAFIAYLGGASAIHSQSRIYNNIFYTTDYSTYNVSPGIVFIHSSKSVSDIYFYNNTIYNVSKAGFFNDFASATNVEVKNNIWTNSNFTYPRGNVGYTSSSNNGYFNNTGRGAPATTESSDPFVNSLAHDFQLKATAKAVDNGTSLCCYFTTDKNGVCRPQGSAWAIGAYEYSATPKAICTCECVAPARNSLPRHP